MATTRAGRMRFLWAVAAAASGIFAGPAAFAEDSVSDRIVAALKLGLPIVEKAAANYPTHRKCFSCHHQTLPMLSVVCDRDAGGADHETLLKAQGEFTRHSFHDQIEDLREGKGIGGRALTVSYGLWALRLAKWPADETTQAMVAYLIKTQKEDGHWEGQAKRPPMEESFATCTALAVAGMRHFATDSQKDELDAALAKAKTWLLKLSPESQEDKAARLWGLHALAATPEELSAARETVVTAQRDDGGWPQAPGMESDAYATGQSLFVLHATGLAATAPAYQRGVEFLLKTQRPDGSWFVESRSDPVQVYFDNGDPHGKNQFISTPATCWALAALTLGRERREPPPQAAVTSLPIRVHNPRRLGTWQIAAERIALGEAYKPSLARLADGELVMVGLYQDQLGGGKLREWAGLWRSADGGRTWTERVEAEGLLGREQWLTATRDGTLLATSHLLAADVRNPDGYSHSYLHRSTDGGRSWERTRIGPEGFPAKASTTLSRNVVEMPDGTLLLGVGVNELDMGRLAWLWRSTDGGRTWDKSRGQVTLGTYQGRPYHNWDGFFSEDFSYLTVAGKLLHFLRCGPPSPMYPMNDGRAVPSGDDGIDRMLRCESSDGGASWSDLADHGDYGVHYPRVLRLGDGRLLLTFTQRSVTHPIGLQAVLSHDDGATWDFANDRIVIEARTPWGQPQGGGFGNTIELADGLLVSCYTYRAADGKTYLEVVRWRLPAKS